MCAILEDESTLVIDFYAKINDETAKRFRIFTTDLIKKKRPKTLYLAMSSTGGKNTAAFVFYQYLLSLDLELITHATGIIESSAVSVFLAGSIRYSNPRTKFLINAPMWTFDAKTRLGSAKLKEYAEIMDWEQKTHESIICARTTATAEQVSSWHLGSVLDSEEALNYGFFKAENQFIRPKKAIRFSD